MSPLVLTFMLVIGLVWRESELFFSYLNCTTSNSLSADCMFLGLSSISAIILDSVRSLLLDEGFYVVIPPPVVS